MVELVDNEAFNEKIQVILRNTDYDEELATSKLKFFSYDHVKVIRDYLGIVDKKPPVIKSINQEIYKQFREKLHIEKTDIEQTME
jgi:hypothetical protein